MPKKKKKKPSSIESFSLELIHLSSPIYKIQGMDSPSHEDELKRKALGSTLDLIKKVLTEEKELKQNHPFFKLTDYLGGNLIHLIIFCPQAWGLARYIPQLKQLGANINFKNKNYLTPFFYAAQLGHEEGLKYLFEAGVDLTTTTIDGNNFLDFALAFKNKKVFDIINGFLKIKNIQLTASAVFRDLAEAGELKRVKYLKQLADDWELKVNINSKHPVNKRTPLIAAAQANQAEIVSYLLEIKADPNIQDYEEMNALMHATNQEDQKAIDLLLPVTKVNQFVFGYRFRLLGTAAKKNPQLVKTLLAQIIDINAENAYGESILNTALYLNDPLLIDLLLNHPDLDLGKSSNPFKILLNAINYCEFFVLEKLLKICKLNLEGKQGALLYYSTISLNKKSHFKVLLANGINLDNPSFHPLICVILENKTIWLSAFLSGNYDRLNDSFFDALLFAIKECTKKTISSALRALFNLPEFKQLQSEHDFNRFFSLITKELLKRKWLDLALITYPKLKFFIYSNMFHDIPLSQILKVINRLEGNSLPSIVDPTPKSVGVGLFAIKTTLEDFSDTLKRIPGLEDYKPFSNSHWEDYFRLFTLKNTAPIQTISPTSTGQTQMQTPFAFFKQQGLSKQEISGMLLEVKARKKTTTVFPAFESKKSNPISSNPSTWFGGQISSEDVKLIPIESSSSSNEFLLIPSSLQEDEEAKSVLNKSRWHFNNHNGLKPLKGEMPVEICLYFGDNQILYQTLFTHEITDLSEDRVLCVKVAPDQPEGRGILYMAALYLEGGLHHRRTPLPSKVKVIVSTPESQLTLSRTSTFS